MVFPCVSPTAEQHVATLNFEGEGREVPLDLVVLALTYCNKTEVNYLVLDPTQVRSATCSVHCMYEAFCYNTNDMHISIVL